MKNLGIYSQIMIPRSLLGLENLFIIRLYCAITLFCPERLLWGPRRYGLTFRCTPLSDRFNASLLMQVLCCIDFFLLTLFTQMSVTFYAVLLFYLCTYLCFYAYVLCQKWRNKDVQSINQWPVIRDYMTFRWRHRNVPTTEGKWCGYSLFSSALIF